MSRPQVFIADLVCALDELSIESADVARAVMRMLSLESAYGIDLAPSALPAEALVTALPAPARTSEPAAAIAQRPSTEARGPAVPGESTQVTMSRIGEVMASTSRPLWAAHTPALPRALRTVTAPAGTLFDPRQERALLAGLCACLDEDDSLDVDRLVTVLAEGSALRELPRQRSWGTRRGLQVLIDDGPGMAPFRGDITRLMTRLAALLPVDRLQRAAFEGSPMRGCRVPRRRATAWRVPVRDSAVLVITDLGIAETDPPGSRASVAEWLGFADVAQAAGVQLRALVPYPAARWPRLLRSRLHPLPWDRQTTAALVRRTLALAA